MQGVLHALAQLIQTVNRNIVAALLMLLVLMVIALGAFAHYNLSHLMSRFPTVAQEQVAFGRSVVLNDLIITELQDLVRMAAADRVNINQFRNGSFDLTGVPFSFSAISYSAAATGVSLDERATTPAPLSVYNDYIPTMWRDTRNPVCVIRNIDQITHPVLRFRMQDRGTQVLALCPVTSPQGGAMGFISVEYLRREARRPGDEEVFSLMNGAAGRTVGYLVKTITH